jgi:ABC-type sugar transport system ATPase subunit
MTVEAPGAPREGGGTDVAIAAREISKRFGHVQALQDVSLSVAPGEIVALYGDNGAGKSTLMKVMLGVLQPDAGAIEIGGKEVRLATIRDSQAFGVDAVHQDLALPPDLSVLDSMFLGHELLRSGLLGRLGFLNRRRMGREAGAALERLAIRLPSLRVDVASLSGGQRQAVAVARAELWTRTALLMDEPTAALGTRQSDIVCETIVSTAGRGLGVLVISHDLPRTLEIAHRVVVLVRGTVAMDRPAAGLTIPEIVEVMVGHLGKRYLATGTEVPRRHDDA